LTADHGGLDIPERLRAKGVADAAWVDPELMPARLNERLSASLRVAGSIIASGGPSGDIFLDAALSGADRAKALERLLATYRAHPQVEAVFTKDQVARTPIPSGSPTGWSLIGRVRASFDPERSGDLYVVLKPHIQPIADTRIYVSTHGSPWDYDRRVPILFWRPGMVGSASDEAIETIKIMPTLAAWLGVPAGTVDGRCLSVPGVTCLPR
jgi:hypothetical protein